MTNNPVRRALLARTLTLGTWIQIGHPAVAEILAGAGFDWLAVDCEHTEIGLAELTQVMRGMYGRGPAPLVRVRENDTLAIRQVLDVGAQGVIVPLVNSPDEARRAVAAARYPPQGIRGHAFGRVNNHGADFAAYAASANDDVPVVVMIETRQAVECIRDILAVEGVDGVFIGPYDLSASYGLTGQTGHPVLLEARQQVLAACRQAGKAAGIHVVLPTPEAISGAVADGFTFIAAGVDVVFLREGSRAAVAAARGEA